MDEQGLRTLVGSRIRAERVASGYNLDDLAGRIGMHESNLSRIERGERGIDITTLMKVGEALGLRSDAFLQPERDEVIGFARTAAGGRDTVIDWTLDLLADMRFAEAEVQRHGW